MERWREILLVRQQFKCNTYMALVGLPACRLNSATMAGFGTGHTRGTKPGESLLPRRERRRLRVDQREPSTSAVRGMKAFTNCGYSIWDRCRVSTASAAPPFSRFTTRKVPSTVEKHSRVCSFGAQSSQG